MAEKDSYFLKATANTLELICLRSGESLFGGKREYLIEGEKLRLQEQGETPDEESTILSLSKNRMDLATFNGWSRASFKKADDETVEHMQAVINPPISEEPVVAPEEPKVVVSIAGIWEKAEAAMPFPGNGLIVEINEKQIRAQVFSQASKTQFDLVGAQQPCTYSLEFDKKAKVGKGMIFCKHNNKTYSMKVCLPDDEEKDSMNIEFGSWKFALKLAQEERLSEISQALGNSLKRLTSE